MYNVNYSKLADMGQAKRDAEKLFKAGEDRWGTDEEEFIRIFSTRHYYQLRATWNEYVKVKKLAPNLTVIIYSYIVLLSVIIYSYFVLLSTICYSVNIHVHCVCMCLSRYCLTLLHQTHLEA